MEIRVPQLPESVSDAVVAAWLKKEGDFIRADEPLLELETDKVVLEVTSPKSGVLSKIVEGKDATVVAEQVLAMLDESEQNESSQVNQRQANTNYEPPMSPSVRQRLAELNLDYHDIKGSGDKGRILKTDIAAYIEAQQSASKQSKPMQENKANNRQQAANTSANRPEKRVTMTRLRQRIAERLVEAQRNAAILTTFNDVDLSAIKKMRQTYQSRFQVKHGTKLGFMSFFAKAATEALKRFPEVNARIDGDEIVYNGYYDIGVAVSTERGLVVPIIRNVDQLSYAQIEQTITDYAERARNNHLDIEELKGGTFSISNGGVFGSMLSTPILNPPQSAILGMHKIEDRAIVIDGEITIRPMMYLALSYDHRIIDGKTAVSFLIKIKELLEDPASLLLEL